MDGFEKVCAIKDLKEGVGKRFIINNVDIAIFLVDKKVYSLSNVCPHQHSALIYDGFLEDEFVVCPAHGWKFNLETGKTPESSNGLVPYETRVIDGFVYVKVEKKNYSW